MEFDETSPGNCFVTGEQTLSFVIDVTVAAVGAQVIINTNSVTAFSGTGTGGQPRIPRRWPATARSGPPWQGSSSSCPTTKRTTHNSRGFCPRVLSFSKLSRVGVGVRTRRPTC